jgi:hypothetical protein
MISFFKQALIQLCAQNRCDGDFVAFSNVKIKHFLFFSNIVDRFCALLQADYQREKSMNSLEECQS